MDEPDVKHFNSQLYALWWMARACAEYLLHLSSTVGAIELDLVTEFMDACERNVDLAYVFHFLFDFAFLVLDFKQSVRANDSRKLDMLWREFYSIGRTNTANKTQYAQMSIMRVFWGEALAPPLAQVYHSLRAIPMSEGSYVGWDTPIEWLNGAITDGVSKLVSEQRIARFVAQYAFVDSNYHSLLHATQCDHTGGGKMRELDSNVAVMKQWLMQRIGEDWNSATRVNVVSNLDMERGGTKPWEEVKNTMLQDGDRSVANNVAGHVRGLTDSFFSFSP